jgi:hypothetical protein
LVDSGGVRRVGTATLLVAVAVFGMATAAVPRTPASAGPPSGAGACPIFPADSFWHADVSALPVHASSGAWLASMGGPDRHLHPDFGDSGGAQPYGIPYAVVDGAHTKTAVTFDYADESDAGPYPFGPDTPVEAGSDAHALMLDRDACRLSELYAANWNGGSPTAGSGAVFDLRSNALRPSGWTSADAAGLAIFLGLLRLDEVRAGTLDHVVRVTASRTDRRFVWPARHQAGSASDASLPPMGAWFRLKSTVDVSRYQPETQVILRAFQKHGLIVADNGSNWYFIGSADAGWPDAVLNELKSISAGSFEAVDTSSLMVQPDSGEARGNSTSASPVTTKPATVTTTPRAPSATHATATTTRTAPLATSTTIAPIATAESTTTFDPTTTTTTLVSTATSLPATRTAARQQRGWLWLLAMVPLVALAVWRLRRRITTRRGIRDGSP